VRLAIVSLEPGLATTKEPVNVQLVIDVLWAFATAADGVEHISARVAADCIHIGIYVHAQSSTDADQVAVGLVERAMQAHSVLGRWNIEF
jgi:hypothetical protein